MNIVITGANGSVASALMEYFSGRAAYVVGTVRQLENNIEQKISAIIEMDPHHHSVEGAINLINDEAGDIHVWMNVVGGPTMGNHIEENNDSWNYMYNTNFMTALNCCQQIFFK